MPVSSSYYYSSQGYDRGLSERKLYIADLSNASTTDGRTDISGYVTSVAVNYSMDMASQIQFDIVDPGLRMANNNYFILGRDVIYETQTIGSFDSETGRPLLVNQLFEIADVTVSQGPGGSPSFSVTCYTKAIQQMKRDKKTAGTINGQGTAFVREAAQKYGLKFVGQETTKKQTITKASGSKQADSLWDVIKRLAGDAKFVVYEVDGFLIFGSEKWLLHKWGIETRVEPKFKTVDGVKKRDGTKTLRWMPLQYPNSGPGYVGRPDVFRLVEAPTITKKENDPYAGEGSCTVQRVNGTQLRPGMTAYVGLVPNMSGYYLIDSISFNELVPDPVSVSFRTPTRDEEKEKPRLLPIGKIYKQTYIPKSFGAPISVSGVNTKVKTDSGLPIARPQFDARILPVPTAIDKYSYPRMNIANLSTALGSFRTLLRNPTVNSTNDLNSLITVGNTDLWLRPVLPGSKTPLTVASLIVSFQSGGSWRAGLVPVVYTIDALAVLKGDAEVLAYVNSVGAATYFSGAGKHFGVVSGDSKKNATTNARDYLYLLESQQEVVLANRFPSFSNDLSKIPNTAGGADSLWLG